MRHERSLGQSRRSARVDVSAQIGERRPQRVIGVRAGRACQQPAEVPTAAARGRSMLVVDPHRVATAAQDRAQLRRHFADRRPVLAARDDRKRLARPQRVRERLAGEVRVQELGTAPILCNPNRCHRNRPVVHPSA